MLNTPAEANSDRPRFSGDWSPVIRWRYAKFDQGAAA